MYFILSTLSCVLEQSVREGGEAWFINFYSAMCSHCHQLAPAWRKLARRVQGVVRVAAVNCEEDWVLCRNERVQSYPTLVYYPSVSIIIFSCLQDVIVYRDYILHICTL